MEFDKPFVMVLAAPRGSGKSYFVRKMWNEGLFEHYDYIIVMCPSLNLNDDYYAFGSRKNVTLMPKFGKNDVEKLFRMQEKAMEKVKAQQRGEAYSSEPVYCPETLLILDDCIVSFI